MPLIDLHAHYPMHTKFPPRIGSDVPDAGKELEFWAANLLLNYNAGPPTSHAGRIRSGEPRRRRFSPVRSR